MSETPPAAEPRRARVGRLQRVSLRARLVAGLIAVVLVGLVAGNVIIFENIENYLIGGVDGHLLAAVPSVTQSLRFHQPITFNANIPNGTYGAAYTTTGLKVTGTPAPSARLAQDADPASPDLRRASGLLERTLDYLAR